MALTKQIEDVVKIFRDGEKAAQVLKIFLFFLLKTKRAEEPKKNG